MTDEYRARLLAARNRIGLSPRLMAKMLLTPRQTYEQWEAGSRRAPGIAIFAIESIRAPGPTTIKGRIIRLVSERLATTAEIAAALRKSEQLVQTALWELRRDGYPLPVRRRIGRGGGRPPRTTLSPRDAQIHQDRRAGEAITIIAARYGLTKQRVSQIIRNKLHG